MMPIHGVCAEMLASRTEDRLADTVRAESGVADDAEWAVLTSSLLASTCFVEATEGPVSVLCNLCKTFVGSAKAANTRSAPSTSS